VLGMAGWAWADGLKCGEPFLASSNVVGCSIVSLSRTMTRLYSNNITIFDLHAQLLIGAAVCFLCARAFPTRSAPHLPQCSRVLNSAASARCTFTHTHADRPRAYTDVFCVLGGRQALVAGAHGCVGQVGLRWSSQLACP